MAKRYQPERVFKAIGLKIRSIRERKGLTLEEAEGEGLSWQQLQKIESGRNITIRTLVRIANLFGMHPSEILEGV